MKHFVWAFVAAVAIYAALFAALEYRRAAKGPWEITFSTSAEGEAVMLVNQHELRITNATVVFAGRTSPLPQSATVTFREPRQPPFEVPFGKCVFMDLTSLPGSVTLQLFGHQVELMPRRTIVDGEARTWAQSQRIELSLQETNRVR